MCMTYLIHVTDVCLARIALIYVWIDRSVQWYVCGGVRWCAVKLVCMCARVLGCLRDVTNHFSHMQKVIRGPKIPPKDRAVLALPLSCQDMARSFLFIVNGWLVGVLKDSNPLPTSTAVSLQHHA